MEQPRTWISAESRKERGAYLKKPLFCVRILCIDRFDYEKLFPFFKKKTFPVTLQVAATFYST